MSKALFILGMHRSGTSLLAKWIHNAGINLGDQLLGENYSNPAGHFEDLDFIRLHEEILKKNDLDFLVHEKNVSTLMLDDQDRQRMKNLIIIKQKQMQWGWKEPRSCLFADEYLALLENPYVLIIYRDYSQVVDSLIRRNRKRICTRKNKFISLLQQQEFNIRLHSYANKYLSMWILHHSKILDTLDKYQHIPRVCLPVKDIELNISALFYYMSRHWKFRISEKPDDAVFEKSALTTQIHTSYKFDKDAVQRANEIVSRLETLKNESEKLLGLYGDTK